MRIAAIHAMLVGAFLIATSGDASAQRRGGGGGGYRGGNYSYGNSWSSPRSYGYNSYGYSPLYGGIGIGVYGGGYSRSYYSSPGYYSTPGYYYSQPSYSYVVPSGESPSVITQTSLYEPVSQNQAYLTITVPNADAQVWLQGIETTSRGMERTFYSPPLESNSNYTYTVKARWMVDGKPVEQMRDVPIKAGQRSTVDFRLPANESAPRPAPSPLPTPEVRPNK